MASILSLHELTTLLSRRASTIEVQGSIGSAIITATGSANVSLAKVKGPVQVNGVGASDIFVEADPAFGERMIITGTGLGASHVRHAGGECDLSKLSSAIKCEQVAARTFAIKPVVWTRDIDINYASTCEGRSRGTYL